MDDRNDLTQGVIWKKLIYFFIPIAIGTVVQQLYSACDAAIVGKFVGTTALAAVSGSSIHLINLVIGFSVEVTAGAAIVISHLFGADDEEQLSKAVHTSFTFFGLLSILLTIIGIVITPAFLRIMQTPEGTMPEAIEYLRIIFLGTFAVIIFNMGTGILRSIGDSRSPFIILLITCAFNILADIVCVVFLHMGVSGAAVATVASQILNMILVLYFVRRIDGAARFHFSKLGIDGRILARILKLGIPSGLQGAMYIVANMVLQIPINTLGEEAVAGWALMGKYDGFFWAITVAVDVAITTFIGQNYGADKKDRIRETIRVSFILFTGITLFFSALFLVTGKWVFVLFSNDPLVQKYAWRALKIFAETYLLFGISGVLAAVLRGVGDVTAVAVINGIGICAFRIIWAFTVFPMYPSIECISWCFPLSWVIIDVLLIFRYLRLDYFRNTK